MMIDINIELVGNLVFVRPRSACGLLWLQTHFPKADWDYIAKQFSIDRSSAAMMVIDAEMAGLIIEHENDKSTR